MGGYENYNSVYVPAIKQVKTRKNTPKTKSKFKNKGKNIKNK